MKKQVKKSKYNVKTVAEFLPLFIKKVEELK